MNFDKIKLVYYSPTGTSKRTVEAIQQGIGIDHETIDLTLPESEMKTHSLGEKDLAIIAVPVYSGRVAPTAAKRIVKIKGKNTPAVLVAVYGNRAFEDALVELQDITQPNGFKTIAAGAFIGEHSYDAADTPIATGRPDEEDLKKAKEFGEQIKQKLNAGKLDTPAIPGNRPYREGGKTGGRCPVTDPEKCTLCEKCAIACPVGCITVTDVVETEIDVCTACSACIKVCPTWARYWEHEGVLKAAKWLSTEHGDRKEPEYFL